MHAKPVGTFDRWLTHSFGRGAGALVARLPGSGDRAAAERGFYFRYVDADGRRQNLKIGIYSQRGTDGGITVAEALRKAAELSHVYQAGELDLEEYLERRTRDAAGLQPAVEPQTELGKTQLVTMRRLFERWQQTELVARTSADGKRTGRKDGGEYVRLLFEARVFPSIGDLDIREVRKSHAMAILDQARTDGKLRTANVLLQTMKQCLRFALVRELIDRNPLDTIARRDAGGAEAARQRVLSAAEIKTLATSLPAANLDPRSVCATWLILATAVRIGEAMMARWEHVDLEARLWLLPETKNQRPHSVHLSDFAVRQLKEIRRLQDERQRRRVRRERLAPGSEPSNWVFSNRSEDGHVDIRTFGKQLADRQRTPDRVIKNRSAAASALSLPGGRWTPHDLRRTAATMMAELGVSGDVIDECLNHQIESRVRRTYVRDRRMAEQAKAFDLLGARLEELTKVDGEAATAPPHRRRRRSSDQ